MKTKRIENISITELCQKAGVSRSYYYKRFRSFDDVITQNEILGIIGYIRKLPNQQKISFETLMTHYFQLVKDNANAQLTLIAVGKEQVLIKAFKTSNQYLEKKGALYAPKFNSTDNQYRTDFLAGAVVNMSISWLKGGLIESPEYMGKKVSQFMGHETNF
ncbi:TetR/AcrR family transcriptional regulator C-terminal domain-containing protein [Lentilactobacillus parakefiri]